ncbi:Os08g0174100 [Oryza sativa Japonica Group]|uniref:Anthocyanin 5-aromatic acyltransferase-like protein n=1 Tax=Oryza sativa subsp. japonica TaxID=39947 RepID=Q6Z4U8_ORYSJ|nr:anthocyanin 5-aromatic acyltransferase-like protein [Oryza sativa Japonica Group]BAF23018.2 Os08g0174100 [Oryza sativa Japonica Group]|eukprot:NP_001061104.2 Os08g0174100 [Oryza sativa Japonica Group]
MGEAAAVSGDAGARARVRVLAVSRVAPSPAPVERERVGLSFFDTPWVVLPPIQRVFLYEMSAAAAADGGGGDGFAAAVERLKGSLAATLVLYLPLAGKLVYVEETEDVVVDCAAADDADAGVAFVEAEAEDAAAEDMDVLRLAGDEAHDVAAFLALVPELDTRALPAPVLSVQATRLGGGAGLALGLSVHHAVADGRAVWQFMEAWSSAARVGSPVTKSLGAPHYRREAAIPQPDGGELARHMLKLVAPKLPAVVSYRHSPTS